MFLCGNVKICKSAMALKNSIRKRATAIMVEDGKMLLIRRNKPDHEYFVVPGGGVDEGETIEQALVRETMEELSLKVEDFCEVGKIENIKMPEGTSIHMGLQSYYFFHVKKYSGTLALGGEEKESMTEENQYHFVWVPIEDVIKLTNLYPIEIVPILAEYFKKV